MKTAWWLVAVAAVLACVAIECTTAGKDYYGILGVGRSATTQEIKKAYRSLSKSHHPDRFPGDQAAAEKYMLINEAHDVLKDDEKRRIYDQFGEEGLKKQQQGGGGGGGFGDMFADLFGFGRQGGRRQESQLREGPSMEVPLEVTLEDLYLGRELEVLHKKQLLCRHCRGTGAENHEDIQKCPVCHGSGRQTVERRHGNMIIQQQVQCGKCGGRGQTIAHVCSKCHGSKVSDGESYLTVVVEKGMPERHRITFRGEMDQAPDTQPGDLHFVVVTAPHPTFTREANNLRMKLKISLLEALTGFSKSFRHLDGHEFTVARTHVTTPGFVQKIPGQGMPIHESTAYGDLLVEYAIVFPRLVTDEQKKVFRELLKD